MAEWQSIDAPHLRIVAEDVWTAVHARLGEARAAYRRGTGGCLHGRPARGVESKYLLPGLARCAECGGSLYVKSRSHGRQRAYFYGCTSFHLRGRTVCSNSVELPMGRSDEAVLEAIERDVLRPDVIAEALRKAKARLLALSSTSEATADRARLSKRLAVVDRDLEPVKMSGPPSSVIFRPVNGRPTRPT